MTIQGISYLLCSTKISTCVAHRTLELVGDTRANEVHLCPLAVQKYLLSKSLTYEYGHVNDTRVHHLRQSRWTSPAVMSRDIRKFRCTSLPSRVGVRPGQCARGCPRQHARAAATEEHHAGGAPG